MTRSRRRLFACLGILGIVFAQLAVTAHACALRANAMSVGAPAATTTAQKGHCGGPHASAAPQAPSGNACEVQCTDGAPVTAAPDLPPVMQVAMILPSSPPAVPVEARARDRSVLASSGAAPPRALQFCRLLI
jgi:hypothetical protein